MIPASSFVATFYPQLVSSSIEPATYTESDAFAVVLVTKVLLQREILSVRFRLHLSFGTLFIRCTIILMLHKILIGLLQVNLSCKLTSVTTFPSYSRNFLRHRKARTQYESITSFDYTAGDETGVGYS